MDIKCMGRSYQIGLLPLMTLRIMETKAMNRRICINPPTLYPRKPIAHPITRIKAIT
jgi:hypothetical protein